MTLRLGTRGSDLALAQAEYVARRLAEQGRSAEIQVIQTSGDRQADRPFADVGQAGVFVREIEQALLERRIDLAVHSYKDLPAEQPDGLTVAAVPERADPADVLLIRASALDRSRGALPVRAGARVGTASARRAALLRWLRPDLEPVLLRGNVPTRVARLREGRFDAILVAAAGLERLARRGLRLDFGGLESLRLDPADFVPAPSQGALAIEVRAADAQALAAAASIDDAEAHRPVRAERELLRRVEGGCQSVVGAWCARVDGGALDLIGLCEHEGRIVRARSRGQEPLALARAVHEQLRGGGDRS